MPTEHEEHEPDLSSEIRKHILALHSNGGYFAQQDAADALVKIGVDAVESLILTLQEMQGGFQREVVRALGQIGDIRAVEPLLQALEKEEEGFRWLIPQALGRIGDVRAIEPLLRTLNDDDPVIRVNAAGALARMGNDHAFDLLILALKDSNHFVTHHTAGALGETGDYRAFEPLLVALDEGDSDLRIAVSYALYEMESKESVPLRVIREEHLSAEQRIQLLERLSKVHHKTIGFHLRYKLPAVAKYCRQLLDSTDVEEAVKRGAVSLLQELERQKQSSSLLRGYQQDHAHEEHELLRGVTSEKDNLRTEAHLRPSQSPPDAERKKQKQGWWQRLIGNR